MTHDGLGPGGGLTTIVREARDNESESVASVLRRSIAELCIADHGGDPEILTGWLRNKTADQVLVMMRRETVLVAVTSSGDVAGVGAADLANGEITLNYVSPDFRLQGVSTALLRALETCLADAGHAVSRLVSTTTARQFYRARGYAPDGKPQPWRGGRDVYPMLKRLA